MKTLYFAIAFICLSLRAYGNENRVVEYINDSLAQIPGAGQSIAGGCGTEVRHSGKSVYIRYYDLKIVPTYSGPPAQIKKYVLDSPYPSFNTADEAALFFTDFIKKNFRTDTVEYCAVFVKRNGKVSFDKFFRGTPGSCPTGDEKFPGAVAGIHTHPGGGHQHEDLSMSIQTPSFSDYAVAVHRDIPQYMAGPAGQILKYDKSNIECRGSKFHQMIRLNFQELRKAGAGSRGRFNIGESFQMVNQQQKTYLQWLCPELAP